MKALIPLLFLVSFQVFALEKYQVYCNDGDCFSNGWKMYDSDGKIFLVNQCKENNCRTQGWKSVDFAGQTFDVTCIDQSCFGNGWESWNERNGKNNYDKAICKGKACLVYGWKVKTGYDIWGGDVTCGNHDCSRFGGVSFWRGKASKTVCHDMDCYHNGWTLTIY